MLFEKCGNLYQIYWSSPNCAGSFFTVVNDANDSYRYDKSHVVTRRVDKQDVTIGGLPDKTRQATRTAKGKAACGLDDRRGGRRSLRAYRIISF